MDYERVENCYQSMQSQTDIFTDKPGKPAFRPKVALILGSGLGELADEICVLDTVSYKVLSGFPQSTVAGHAGRFVFGYMEDTPVVIMQGRVHYYEGYPMEDVVLPTRLMHRMGAEILFLTNAAGGISKAFHPGTLMMITDQIASFVPSPLLGPNEDRFGARFPDMSSIYRADLQAVIREAASREEIELKEGTYIQFTGPQYETPAEVRMAGLLGADACGMSTACEAIAANHMGMRVCGISCITNMASGLSDAPLNHKEVQETADRVSREFKRLVRQSVKQMRDV